MQKRIKGPLTILAVALLLLTASGCAGQNAKPVVMTAVAGNQELEKTLGFSGVLVPAQTAEISSQIAGHVTSLDFQVGSTVKAGGVLMQLDTRGLSAQLLQAEAGLQSAEAAAQTAENQASLAKIGLDAAQKSFDRTKTLYDAGAASQSQLDDAKDQLSKAAKQYETAAGPAQAQAQAAVSTARANVKSLDVQLDEAAIRSPIDGSLTSQSVNVGEVVSPGVVVMSVVNTAILNMKSTVTQDTLPLLATGQDVDIAIDGYPNGKFKGSISRIGPIAVSTGEVFPIEITIKNDGSLMAGLSAQASMTVKTRGIVVPSAAVIQNNGSSYVFVIRDNAALKRPVSVGLKSDKATQILKGLDAGERVAVTNVNALADNTPVSVAG